LQNNLYEKGKILVSDSYTDLKPNLIFGITLEKLKLNFLVGDNIYQAIIVNINSRERYPTPSEKEKAKVDELKIKFLILQQEKK